MKTYRVNLIRSRRAVEREGLEPRTLEKHVGDFNSFDEAFDAYMETSIGTETDREMIYIDEDGNEFLKQTTY